MFDFLKCKNRFLIRLNLSKELMSLGLIGTHKTQMVFFFCIVSFGLFMGLIDNDKVLFYFLEID